MKESRFKEYLVALVLILALTAILGTVFTLLAPFVVLGIEHYNALTNTYLFGGLAAAIAIAFVAGLLFYSDKQANKDPGRNTQAAAILKGFAEDENEFNKDLLSKIPEGNNTRPSVKIKSLLISKLRSSRNKTLFKGAIVLIVLGAIIPVVYYFSTIDISGDIAGYYLMISIFALLFVGMATYLGYKNFSYTKSILGVKANIFSEDKGSLNIIKDENIGKIVEKMNTNDKEEVVRSYLTISDPSEEIIAKAAEIFYRHPKWRGLLEILETEETEVDQYLVRVKGYLVEHEVSIAFKVDGYEAIFHVNHNKDTLKKLDEAARISTETENAAQGNPTKIGCDAKNKNLRSSSNNGP